MVDKRNLKAADAPCTPGAADPRALAREQRSEDAVYGTLGALLGTLEVVATDDLEPIAARHAERLGSALRLCETLQHQMEVLLTLGAEDLAARLRRARCSLRPLLEHAVQGAKRCFAQHGVDLRMPAPGSWAEQAVLIDSSRVDRMVRVLTEALVASVGRGGTVAVSVQEVSKQLALELRGTRRTDAHPAQARAPVQRAEDCPLASSLLARGARRLFELHSGGCDIDAEQLSVHICLPVAEAP